MPLNYDPTGISPNNLVSDVPVDTTVSIAEWPSDGAFFGNSLLVTAISTADPSGPRRQLLPTADYLLAPLFISASLDVGQPVYGYFLILTPSKWSDIEYTLQSLALHDTVLANEYAAVVGMDTLAVSAWTTLQGETGALRPAGVNPILSGQSGLDVFSDKITDVVEALRDSSSSLLDDAIANNSSSNIAQDLHLSLLTARQSAQDQLLVALQLLGTTPTAIRATYEPHNLVQDGLIAQNTTDIGNIPVPTSTVALSNILAGIAANVQSDIIQDVTITANTDANSDQDILLDQIAASITTLGTTLVPIDLTAIDVAINADDADLGDIATDLSILKRIHDIGLKDTEQDGRIIALRGLYATLLANGAGIDLGPLTAAVAENLTEIQALQTQTADNTTHNTEQNEIIGEHRVDIDALLAENLEFDPTAILARLATQEGKLDTLDLAITTVNTHNDLQDTRIDRLLTKLRNVTNQPTISLGPLFDRVNLTAANRTRFQGVTTGVDGEQPQQDLDIEANRIGILGISNTTQGAIYDTTDLDIDITANEGIIDQVQQKATANTETIIPQNRAINALEVLNAAQDANIALVQKSVECGARVISPTIEVPVKTSTFMIVLSDFVQTIPEDVHETTDVQVSTTPDFTDIKFNSIGGTPTNEVLMDTPLADGDYFIRARYGSALQVGVPWGPTAKINLIETGFQISTIGTWTTLHQSNPRPGDNYGCSVAFADGGAVLVVGSFNADVESSNGGRVYIYDWNTVLNQWDERQALTPRLTTPIETDEDGVVIGLGTTTQYQGNGVT